MGLTATFFYPIPAESRLSPASWIVPTTPLAFWDDGQCGHRRVVGLGGKRRPRRGSSGYESVFRSFSINMLLSAPMSGDARRDASTLIQALRRGRVFSAIDSLAGPAAVRFEATSGNGNRFRMGDQVPAGVDVEIAAAANVPEGAELLLLANGVIVEETTGPDLRYQVPTEGDRAAYRLEIRLPEAPGNPPIPWIVTNPIYHRGSSEPTSSSSPSPAIVGRRRLLAAARETREGESSPRSVAGGTRCLEPQRGGA